MQKGFQSHLEGKPTNARSVLCETAFLCTMCGDEVKSAAIEQYDPLTDNWQFYNLCGGEVKSTAIEYYNPVTDH